MFLLQRGKRKVLVSHPSNMAKKTKENSQFTPVSSPRAYGRWAFIDWRLQAPTPKVVLIISN